MCPRISLEDLRDESAGKWFVPLLPHDEASQASTSITTRAHCSRTPHSLTHVIHTLLQAMRSSLASTTRNVHALVRASNLATSGHFNKTLGSRNATHYGFAAATTEAKGLTRDAVVRAYSVDPSVGASISRQMKDAVSSWSADCFWPCSYVESVLVKPFPCTFPAKFCFCHGLLVNTRADLHPLIATTGKSYRGRLF